jgi:hypothetical protein
MCTQCSAFEATSEKAVIKESIRNVGASGCKRVRPFKYPLAIQEELLELEFELIHTQMAQKQMPRAEVY